MDIITYKRCKKLIKKYIKDLAGGMKYMGSVPTAADLPTPKESIKGHAYTTSDNGHEHVCDGTQWIDLSADLEKKQDKLTAGENITIDENNVISATGGASYTAGNGIDITDNTIAAKLNNGLQFAFGGIAVKAADSSIEVGDMGVNVRKADTSLAIDGDNGLKVNTNVIQSKLTAGANVQITDNTISATDTKYTAGDNVTISTDNKISATDTKYTAGTNITIDANNKISATGGTNVEANVEITGDEDELISLKVGDTVYQNLNYHPFPESFDTTHTLQKFGQSVVKYAGFATGCTWFGGLNCTDLPGNMIQCECKVTAIRDKIKWVRNIAIVEIYSSEVAPFYWTYNTDSWDGGTGIDDWKYTAAIDGSKFDSSASIGQAYNVKVKKVNAAAGSTGWEFYTEQAEASLIDGNNVGVIVPFGGNTIPVGYLECNGAAVSRTTYPELFNVIGTIYGPGDGSTTFNLPDLKEKFIEGSSASEVLGTVKSAGLPNIDGKVSVRTLDNTGLPIIEAADKCFNITDDGGAHATIKYNGDTQYAHKVLNFSATNSNSIYGKSDTVQPAALVTKYIIKYTKTLGATSEPDNTTIIYDTNGKLKAVAGGEPSEYLSSAEVIDNVLKINNKLGQEVVNCTVNYTLDNAKVKAVLTEAEKETLLSGVTGTTWIAAQSNISSLQSGKQDKLTAGTNITISADNVISATGGGAIYSAGNGLQLSDNQFSIDEQVTATKADLTNKQDKLTAGTNITISNNTISADDQLPAYPTDTEAEYVLGLKYVDGAWVKYWKETANKSDIVDKGTVDYMVLKA